MLNDYIMKIEDEIILIENRRDVNRAVALFESRKVKSLDIHLRIIFILIDFLVDGNYTEDEHVYFAPKIKDVFEEAKLKYQDNAEFLFFAGIMIYIAEWYFCMSSVDVATSMLYRAEQLDCKNLVYKWGSCVFIDQRIDVNKEYKFSLSKQILNNVECYNWIRSKGLLGKYLLGLIQKTYETYKHS